MKFWAVNGILYLRVQMKFLPYFLHFLANKILHNFRHLLRCRSDQLIPKLILALYAIRTLKQIMSQKTLIMIYYAYFHSVMTHGITFWDNFPHIIHIFQLQKKIIRITNSKNRASCRNLFKNLHIFTFIFQYLYSLIYFVITNTDQYTTNLSIHGRITRQGYDFHRTISNFSLYQTGSYHMGLKVCNRLPAYINGRFYNVNEFKCLLKNFFASQCFLYVGGVFPI
jgi:hypothetical protein